jgi:hypothetical protein
MIAFTQYMHFGPGEVVYQEDGDWCWILTDDGWLVIDREIKDPFHGLEGVSFLEKVEKFRLESSIVLEGVSHSVFGENF